MYFNTLALAALAAFGRGTLAAPAHGESKGYTTTTSFCYTTMGAKPAPYKTYHHTHYTKCTSTSTRTKTFSTTLPSPTTTVTTTTTVVASTSTLTETETAVTTSTVTNTVTETSTTSTVSTSTSTVPTSDGFLPIQTTLPDSSYTGSAGPVAKRDALVDVDVGVTIGSDTKSDSSPLGQPGTSPQSYPKEVDCHTWKPGKCKKKVTIVKTTTTITPRGTVTTTSTETSTNYPSATTTVTTTSTDTTTTTTTVTTTTTTTDLVPGPTVYAACGLSNLADTVLDTEIGNGYLVTGRADVIASTTANLLDCCISAFLVDNGGVFLYAPELSTNCYVSTTTTCPAQTANQAQAALGDEGFGQVTLGNLNCATYSTSR